MMFENIWTPVFIIGGMALIFGLGLAYASHKFRVDADERVAKARELLPGANCGGCGFSGCDAYAEAIVEGKALLSACPVGGLELTSKLSEIMGVEAEAGEKKVARVMCSGTYENCVQKYEYSGIEDCEAAAALYGGPSACAYGCIGLGNCAKACPFDAIVIDNGLARVLPGKCTGCGMCVNTCPKNIIKLVSCSSKYNVRCSSLEKGAVVRKICKVGCIGCRKCSKVCPVDAISFEGTLAKIDPAVCVNCGACMAECPTGAILKAR